MPDAPSDRAAATPATRATARATVHILLAACGFGSIAIFVSLAMRHGATLLTTLTWRYVLGTILLVVAAGGLGRMRLPTRQWVPLALLGGGGQAVVAWISLSALRYIPAATLVFLFYTYPAWLTLLAALRGDERVDVWKAGALGLSLCGIALMVGAPWAAAMHPTGVLLALGAALFYAWYIPLVNRLQAGIPARAASPFVTGGATVCFLGIAAVVALSPAASSAGLQVTLAPAAWGAIGLLAVFSTLLAFIFFLQGLAVLGPVRTAITSTVEPFWTALLGAVVLSQPLTLTTLAGGCLIAAAVLLLQWRAAG